MGKVKKISEKKCGRSNFWNIFSKCQGCGNCEELEKLAKSKNNENEPLKEKVNSYLKEVEDIPLIVSKTSPYSPYDVSFTQKQLSTMFKELEKTFYKYN